MKNILKKLFCLTVAVLLVMALPLSVGAQTTNTPFLQDDAKVLNYLNLEGQWMNATLIEISHRLQLTVAIATVPTLGSSKIDSYTRHYYNNANYPYADGVILLLAMDEREWYIYTTGDAYDYLTDAALDDIEDAIVPLISANHYLEAFSTYAKLCDTYLTMGKEGHPYRGSFPWLRNVAFAIGIGLLVGLLSVSAMRSQLKSVRPRREAHEYTRPGSMNVTLSRDLFLYRIVRKRPRPKDSSGSRSGGSRSGGRGGRF